MSLEDEISCVDPQFANMLETGLQIEVKQSMETLQSLTRQRIQTKYQLKLNLEERADLKDNTKHAQDNLLILIDTLRRVHMQRDESSERIELMELNVDDSYKIMSLEWQKYDDILDQYKQTWDSYHARYEEFPVAKVRKEARMQLQKLRAEKMIIEQRNLHLTKLQWQWGQVTWLQMRGKVIQFARATVNSSKLQRKLMKSRANLQHQRDQLKSIVIELSMQRKRTEEEKKKRAMDILQMPPPKVNFSHIRSICSSRQQMGLTEKWTQSLEDSLDSMSIATVDLEELCETDDDIIEIPNVRLYQATTLPYSASSAFPRIPSVARTTEELCKQNTPKAATESAPKSATVQEHHVEEEAERSSQRDREDKQEEATCQRSFVSIRMDSRLSKHKNEDAMSDDSQAKRMKPMEENVRASVIQKTPTNSGLQGAAKSCTAKRSPGPKITKIEKIRFNVSPISNFAGDIGPSSMFSPRNYEFCDASNISFSMEHDGGSLKADEISLYDGSMRNFYECSNISPPPEVADMESRAANVQNLPSIDGRRSFSQFSFANILKDTGSNKNLF